MSENYRQVLENLMHELGRVNSIIKTSAEAISRGMKGNIDKEALSHHSDVILENSFLFSTHLDIVNYQLNPAFFSIEQPSKRNLYGKFYKAVLSYQRSAKSKDISFNLGQRVDKFIDAYPVIDTLPILLIDNAFKYSPKCSEIDIEFFDGDNDIEVTISNIGPHVPDKEIELIFQRGYRGSEAIKTKTHGLGFGLGFVKYICEMHNATIRVESDKKVYLIGCIKYSEFRVNLLFPKILF